MRGWIEGEDICLIEIKMIREFEVKKYYKKIFVEKEDNKVVDKVYV